MGYAERYPAVAAELVSLRASLGRVNGYDVPALSPADMTGVLGVYTRGLLAAITRIANAGIVPSSFVDDEGIITTGIGGGVATISVARYLAGYPESDGRRWSRIVALSVDEADYVKQTNAGKGWSPARAATLKASDVFGGLLTPDFGSLRDPQGELVLFARQAVDDYQKAIDAITAAIQTYGDAPNKNAAAAFLSKIRALGGDLDSLAEAPPTTLTADLKGAMAAAFNASGEALETIGNKAGEIAGKVGNVAGQIAGSTLEGFFSTANLLTILIAGVIVYKVI